MAKVYQAALGKLSIPLEPSSSLVLPAEYTSQGTFIPTLGVSDSHNVLPSQEGYMSYFGVKADLGQVPTNFTVQTIVPLRTEHGHIVLVALCLDRMWIAMATGNSVATLETVDPTPDITHLHLRKTVTWTGLGFTWLPVAMAGIGSAGPVDEQGIWSYGVVNNIIYFYQQGLGRFVSISSLSPTVLAVDSWNPTFIVG
jgi:hypothetical protein